jgi:predicted phosphodiesterase
VRLGLVTDVHSHAAELARALAIFQQCGVDRVVTIGDTIDAFARSDVAAEVAALLLEVNAVGVWGNHDFSLRGDVPLATRARFPESALTFMARMQPRLVIGDCHFSHKESTVDPHDVEQLWDISDRRLCLEERASVAFQAVPQRWQFVGHYHRWWAATPSRSAIWQGDGPLAFDETERYFVVVGATCEGWCGILDIERSVLEPHWCGSHEGILCV